MTASDLLDAGLGAQAPIIAEALAGLDAAGVRAALRLVLAEHAYRPPRLDLVWSGPDTRGNVTRDTGLVVRRLFESAERTVLIGGYSFDTPGILAPLHAVMKACGVTATIFMEIEGHASSPKVANEYTTRVVERFFHQVWTFGPLRPDVYWDPRTAIAGPLWASLHAKCVVADESHTLITSANFTDRGQTRNIEVGVLIDDASFALELVAQWQLLISAGLVRRYAG